MAGRWMSALVAAGLLAPAGGRAAEGARYLVTEIMVPGQYITQITGTPNSINDRDQVVGSTVSNARSFQGFLWSAGVFTLYQSCDVLAVINDRARASGYPASGYGYCILATAAGTMHVAPIHGPTGGLRLEGIDLAGDVVAQATNRAHVAVGLLLTGGKTTILQVPGSDNKYGGTSPTAINSAGLVAGSWSDAAGVTHGFTTAGGSYTSFDMPGGTGTYPTFIAANSDLGGGFTASGSGGVTTGFVREAGVFSTISPPGSTGSYVQGIGPGGEIVGSYFDAAHSRHGFVLRHGRYIPFDVPGASGTVVSGVNHRGSLVGTFYDDQLLPHAFIAQCPDGGCS